MKSKAIRFDELVNSLTRQRCGDSDVSDRLFGIAASIIPQAGMNGMVTVAPMIVSLIFANVGISTNTSKIVDGLPGRDSISNIVIQNTVVTVMLTRENIKQHPIVFFSYNNGNSKGNKNLAKYVYWYCKLDRRVKIYLLDVDCTDKNTGEITDIMRHSLTRLFGIDISNIPTKVYGQCTYSGGGGTGTKLFIALQQLDMTSTYYLTTSCSLHNLQTALRNGVQLVLGKGGLDNNGKGKLKIIQLSHGVYNIQN